MGLAESLKRAALSLVAKPQVLLGSPQAWGESCEACHVTSQAWWRRGKGVSLRLKLADRRASSDERRGKVGSGCAKPDYLEVWRCGLAAKLLRGNLRLEIRDRRVGFCRPLTLPIAQSSIK